MEEKEEVGWRRFWNILYFIMLICRCVGREAGG